MAVIGISCFYHDSAAALVSSEGEVLAAVQEERFTRVKNDSRFPFCAVDYCLKCAREREEEVTAYVYYEKPIRVFMRLLETYFSTAPRGFSSFLPAMQTWITKKLFTKDELIEQISLIDGTFNAEKLFFSDHHHSHAGAAFYPSPFEEAAVLCMDAVGEWTTTSAWIGKGNELSALWELNFPDSIGMLYSAFTYYCGFKVNSGEYKLMGLAPYGEAKYKQFILDKLIDYRADGSFKLKMKFFKYHRGLKMISSEFINLFKMPQRNPEAEISQFYMDIAASVQKVIELLIVRMGKNIREKTNLKNLCLSGGVALNCVANEQIIEQCGFENVWIQPASGDSGSALGAALTYIYKVMGINRQLEIHDSMKSSYLGPCFTEDQIVKFLDEYKITYEALTENQVCIDTANDLSEGKVIGWFQGRMEYGPRALGNRSIIGDPRIFDMQKRMNLKIKFRESFRPFAPVILDGYQKEFFNFKKESPYMLLTRKLDKKFLIEVNSSKSKRCGLDRVNEVRSTLPAITHIDNSCRIQTISKQRNPIFHNLLTKFKELTNSPVLINTSFNIRGEPIVCTPYDAMRCFLYTNIDVLVLGNIKIKKELIKANTKELFLKPIIRQD